MSRSILLSRSLLLLLALSAVPAWTSTSPASAPATPEAGESIRVSSPAPQTTAAAETRELIPTKNLLEIMEKGGILMWPIALCSVLTVAFFLERLIALRWGRVAPKPFVRRVLEQIRQGQLDRQQALALCEENRSPVALVFAAAVRKWGRPAVEVEQSIIGVMFKLGCSSTSVFRGIGPTLDFSFQLCYQLSAISYQLSAISFQLSVVSCQLSAFRIPNYFASLDAVS